MSSAMLTADDRGAVAQADRVLDENRVISSPVLVEELARNYGLAVEVRSFPPQLAGMAGLIDMRSTPVQIVVSAQDSPDLRAFTIARGLGHWLLHKENLRSDPNLGMLPRGPIGSARNKLHAEAITFAANLLVPDRFLKQWPNVDPARLASLFGVSQEVIGFRLWDRPRPSMKMTKR